VAAQGAAQGEVVSAAVVVAAGTVIIEIKYHYLIDMNISIETFHIFGYIGLSNI
jgi:hypothetical protein